MPEQAPRRNPQAELAVEMIIPEGATIEPLLKGPSENYGCTPGFWVYTKAKGRDTTPTGYSILSHPRTIGGIVRSELIDNSSAAILAATELRPGTRGATLITPGGETTHLTATAALAAFFKQHPDSPSIEG